MCCFALLQQLFEGVDISDYSRHVSRREISLPRKFQVPSGNFANNMGCQNVGPPLKK